MRLRTAGPDDLSGVQTLYAELQPDAQLRDPVAARQAWLRVLAQPGLQVIVAELDEGALAATCMLVVLPNLNHLGRPYALLENVVTLPSYRGQGLGHAVVNEALNRAWAAGCYKTMLLTGSKKPETLAFYRSCGLRDGDKTGFIARPV